MNTCLRHIEVFSNKRCPRRYYISYLIFKISGYFCNRCRIHSIKGTSESGIFEHHCLKRNVSRSLAYSKERTVDGAAAVKPGCRSIRNCVIKVIVTVPFKHFTRNTGIVLKTVNYSRHTSRKCRTTVWNAISHGVTSSDFNRNLRFFRELHNLIYKRNYKSIKVSSGQVF